MRRWPIYILVECSEHMAEDLPSVREGIAALVAALCQDPFVIENGYLSIITFAAQARQQSPLAELTGFSLPSKFEAGYGCMFGRAMRLLVESCNKELKPTAATQKGDYGGSVLVIASGNSDDDFFRKLDQSLLVPKLFRSIVVVAAGRNQNVENLTSFHRQSLAQSQKSHFVWGENETGVCGHELWGRHRDSLVSLKLFIESFSGMARSLFPIYTS